MRVGHDATLPPGPTALADRPEDSPEASRPTYPEPVPSAPFVVPPLLLIGVLAVSAVAKLRDPRDTASVFDKLELPRFLSRLRAPLLLPYGELAVAVLLLVLPGYSYVAATTGTLLLFAAYAVVVGRALRFPYRIRCGCFGQLGLGWITPQTFVRNLVLLAVALVTWLDSLRGQGLLQRLTALGDQAWWLAGLTLAVVTTTLIVRESGPPAYLAATEDPDAYAALPIPYALLDGPGGPTTVWRLSDRAARLLVFWNPLDEATSTVAERRPAWAAALDPVQVHLVTRSEWHQAAEVRPDLAEHLLGDPDGETALRLGVHQMPGAVLLGTDRLLAGGPSTGLEEIEELVEAAAAEMRSVGVESRTVPAQP